MGGWLENLRVIVITTQVIVEVELVISSFDISCRSYDNAFSALRYSCS